MRDRSGFGFIGIIIAAAIVLWMAYLLFNVYFKQAPDGGIIDQAAVGEVTGSSPAQQGIDTSSYTGIVQSTRQTLNDIHEKREQDLEDLLQ